jgi:hypothetical protein
LGHATAYTFAAVVAVWLISRRLGGLEGGPLVRSLGKILLGGVATGVAAFAASRLVGQALGTAGLLPEAFQVTGGVAAGFAAFVAVASAFRMPELALIRGMLSSRFGRAPRGAA